MSTNTVTAVTPPLRVSDDEILGITTNGARRPGRNVVDKKSGHTSPTTFSQVKVGDLFLSPVRGENEAADSGSGVDDEAADAAAQSQEPSGDDEQRNAVDDAKAYREIFATPAGAQGATKLLADLNRMDALFFSQRPEDHVELARAVAQLDPQAFVSLARAMSTLSASVPGKNQDVSAANRLSTGHNDSHPATPPNPANAQTINPTPGLTAAQSDFFTLQTPSRCKA